MDQTTLRNPDDTSFEENVQEVLQGLPQPLQDFLMGPERDAVTARITQRHNLHADQAGRFQKAFLFMLMGIFSPEQFAKDLADIGVSPETVRALANDVNEEVFKPLREKEQKPAPTPDAPAPALYIPPPVNPAEATLLQSSPESQSQAPQNPYSGEASPRQSTPVAPVISPPTYIPPATVATPTAPILSAYVAPQPVAPVQPTIQTQLQPPEIRIAPQPPVRTPSLPHPSNEYEGATVRTMATDMLAVREHKEPEPIPYRSANIPPQHPTQVTPASPPLAQPRSKFAVSAPTPLPGQELQPPIKEYGVDPYRETM